MQGNVDLSFRIKGHKGQRPEMSRLFVLLTVCLLCRCRYALLHEHTESKGGAVHNLYVLCSSTRDDVTQAVAVRFRIICDDGKIVEMPVNSFEA